jgi:hypothetical protein
VLWRPAVQTITNTRNDKITGAHVKIASHGRTDQAVVMPEAALVDALVLTVTLNCTGEPFKVTLAGRGACG